MLDFEQVVFRFPGDAEPIIDHLSFRVEPGEFVSIIGASGSGKSTIFRLINRLLVPESGAIRIGKGETAGVSGSFVSLRCGYMPQQDLLFPWRTVEENLYLPMELQGGIPREEQRRRARKALEDVGLGGSGDKRPSELSGGMRQRAAFARTLLTGAELLLLDEPFSALDYLTRIEMREWLLHQWERDKKTVLFITHDVEEAVYLSSRILVAEKSPVRELTSIRVPLGYPRSIESLKDPAVQDLKEELIEKLRRRE